MNLVNMNCVSAKLLKGKVTRNLVLRLQSSTTAATSSVATPEIQIPSRIERGPTDILKALSNTVSRDITAAHYKYHDDPFLMPLSNAGKRIFSLSKEAGRKAAKWIRQEHADLFQHRVADPIIPEFLPQAVYKDKSEVSEKILLDLIKESRVIDAVNVYNLLEENVEIKSKQALLELLCFCNSEDPIMKDLIEERWYQQNSNKRQTSWKHNPVIEKLFTFLKKQDHATTTAAYNTLICGTAKYMKVDVSWNLYEECKQNNIALNVLSYNSIIKLVPYMKDSNDECKRLINNILTSMSKNQVHPNVGTLNAVLSAYSKMKANSYTKDLVRNTLAEFQQIGIQPCLASFYYICLIFYTDDNSTSGILVEIMDALKGKSFTMQDPNDILFFPIAMKVASQYLHDRNIAEKVHELLLVDKNYRFIGDNLKESIYYRHYLSLLLMTDSLEDFMKIYNILVPHVYIPEPNIMQQILQAVEENDVEIGRNFLPQLFSQMFVFNHFERQPLVAKILNLMRVHCKSPPKSPLNKQFAENAWVMWNHIQDENERRKYNFFVWTGSILADLAILLLRNDEFDKTLKIIFFMENEQLTVTNVPSSEQLNDIFQSCVIRGHVPSALSLVQYAVNNSFEEATSMAREILCNLPLDSNQKSKLINLIGHEVLESNVSSNQ